MNKYNKLTIVLCFFFAVSSFAMENNDENNFISDKGLLRVYLDDNSESYKKHIDRKSTPFSNDITDYITDKAHTYAGFIISKNIAYNAFIKSAISSKENLSALDYYVSVNSVFKYKKFIIIIPKNEKYNSIYAKIFNIEKLEKIENSDLINRLEIYKTKEVKRKNVDISSLIDIFANKIEKQEYSMPVFVHGHGGYHLKQGGEKYIAGLLVKDFSSFLQNFKNTNLKPMFLIYQTCCSGGQHLLLPYCENRQKLTFDFDIISSNPSALSTSGMGVEELSDDKIKKILSQENPYNELAKILCAGTAQLCLRVANNVEFIYLDINTNDFLNPTQVHNSIFSNNMQYFCNFDVGSHILHFVDKYSVSTMNNDLFGILKSITNYHRHRVDINIFVKNLSISINTNKNSYSSMKYGDIFESENLSIDKQYGLKNAFIVLKNHDKIIMVAHASKVVNKVSTCKLGTKTIKRSTTHIEYENDYVLISQEKDKKEIRKISKNEYINYIKILLTEAILKTPDFLLDYSCSDKSKLEQEVLDLIENNKNEESFIEDIWSKVNQYKNI